LYELWPVKPAEGRAVYLTQADKQPLSRPSVMEARKAPFVDYAVKKLWPANGYSMQLFKFKQQAVLWFFSSVILQQQ
jgi:hypothetical protein